MTLGSVSDGRSHRSRWLRDDVPVAGLVRTHALDSALLTEKLEVALDGLVRYAQRKRHLLSGHLGIGAHHRQDFV